MIGANPELAVVTGIGKALMSREKLPALVEGAQHIYRRRF